MSRLGRRAVAAVGPAVVESLEVVVFGVGPLRLAVPRDQVKSIRPSPRVPSRLETTLIKASEVPVVSLSVVLGLDRDISVDRRVLEVDHWGGRIGLEVTSIEGIRSVRPTDLHALPPLVSRNCGSRNVLGLLEPAPATRLVGQDDPDLAEGDDDGFLRAPAVALDLTGLLVEQGVEVTEPDPAG